MLMLLHLRVGLAVPFSLLLKICRVLVVTFVGSLIASIRLLFLLPILLVAPRCIHLGVEDLPLAVVRVKISTRLVIV